MSTIFFNITGTVLVLNVLFTLIPNGKFQKYVQFVAGLIVILTVAGNFIHINFDHKLVYFDENAFSYDSKKLENSVRNDLIEESIRNKLEEEFQIKPEVVVVTDNNEIVEVSVFTDYDKEKITEVLTRYCDINRSMIVIK